MVMWKSRIFAFVVAIGIVAVISACSSDGDNVNLTSRTWNLGEYGVSGAMTDSVGSATIRFDGDNKTASGSTGCNSFSGDYSVDGDSLTFGQIAATEIACQEPFGVMDQERDFLRILSAMTTFEVSESELRLKSPGGELVFGS